MLDPKYIAGLFDGEGCIGQNFTNTGFRVLQVSISNNYKPVLDDLKLQFGGGVYPLNKCFQWRIGAADDIFVFLTAVSPHLFIKKAEAAVALAISQTVGSGGRLTDQTILLRERLFDMLTEAGDRRKSFREEVNEHVAEVQHDSD